MKPKFGLFALITILATVSTPLPLNLTASFSTPSVLAQTLAVRKAQADQLLEQGIKQYERGQFEASRQTCQQALTIYQEIKDRLGEAQSLRNLGRAYFRLENYGKAKEYQQQSLAIAREIKDRLEEGRSLNELGNVYRKLGDYNKAKEYYQQSLAIAKEVKDRRGEGNSLADLGIVYHRLRDYNKALGFYQQSLEIRQKIGYRRGEGYSLNALGNVYHDLENSGKAIKYYQQSLTIAREVKDTALEREVLRYLHLTSADGLYDQANKQLDVGQFEAALQSGQQALALYRRCNCRQEEGRTLHNLGWIYYSLGNYTRAIESYQQSLSILREIGDRHTQAWTLGNLGKAYELLGNSDKAIDCYQQKLSISQAIGDRKGEGHSLENLAWTYYSLGDLIRAVKYSQQSLDIAREIGDRQGEVVALATLGTVYGNLGNLTQAINYLQQSLALARKMGERSNEARSLNQLSIIYSKIGDYAKSIDYSKQALAIGREIRNPKVEGHALNNLGVALYESGNFAEAEKVQRAAIQVWESVRPALSDTDKVSIFDTQSHTYANLQGTLIAQNKTNAALEIAERGRARALVERLARRVVAPPQVQLAIRPLAIQQIQQIAQVQKATLVEYSISYDKKLLIWVIKPTGEVAFRWSNLKSLLQQNTSLPELASNSPTIESPTPESGQEITVPWTHPRALRELAFGIALLILSAGSVITIGLLYRRFFLTRKASSPSQAKPRQPVNNEPNNLQKQNSKVLFHYQAKKDSLLKKPLFLWSLVFLAAGCGGGLFFWMSTNQGQRIVDNRNVRNDSLLAQLVEGTRESVKMRERGSEILLRGQNKTQTERLKLLHQILISPIADLLPKKPNDRVIFIPQHSLFLVPFPALQDANGKYLIEKHTILTTPSIQVLDLTRKQKQRLGSREWRVGSGEALVVGNPTMPSVPPQIGEPPQQLLPLPGAEKEAIAIANLLKTQAITGDRATRAAMVQQMSKARIVHLATHGILDEIRGLRSAIALAPSANDDGLLTAEAILDLKLNAELVVLSACDTGRGRITGDGVVGLSRSLISAGVPSVLVSLWAVPDAPTAELMTEFYRNLQRNPNKAQALRQAMLTVMKQHPNPRDWAAFTLIGEAE